MDVGSSRATSDGLQSQLGLLPPPFPALQRHSGGRTNDDVMDDEARRSETAKLSRQRWRELPGAEASSPGNQSDSASRT